MSSIQNKQRIFWIDYARAIGMFLIFFVHTFGDHILTRTAYLVNVPIFFILSGYLIRQKPIKKVIKSGTKNLLIPYLITSFIILILHLFNSKIIFPKTIKQNVLSIIYGIGTDSTNTIIPNLKVSAIGAIWFLLAMFIANIIFQFNLRISQNYLTLLILSLVNTIIGFIISFYIQLPFSINAALISQCYYIFGYSLKKYHLFFKSIKNSLIVLIISAIFTLLIAKNTYFYFNTGTSNNILLSIIGSFIGCYSLILFCQLIEHYLHHLKYVEIFGHYSLVILCFHIINLNCINDHLIIQQLAQIIKINNNIFITFSLFTFRLLFVLISLIVVYHNKKLQKIFAIR